MNTLTGLLLLFFMSFSVLLSKPGNQEKVSKEFERIISTPCSIDEYIHTDSIRSLKYIKNIEKKYSFKFNKYKNDKKSNSHDYIYISQIADVSWSIWIAIGSQGIEHITETWQTKNATKLYKKLYETVRIMYPTWGDPVDQTNEFYVWDGNEFGCGTAMITLVNDKFNNFVSRRVDFGNKMPFF